MRTYVKVTLAVLGIAVLMSPGMAKTRAPADRHVHGTTADGTRPSDDDCVHRAFPQCSGGNWRRTRHLHKARTKPE
jgi:hypothetical protein